MSQFGDGVKTMLWMGKVKMGGWGKAKPWRDTLQGCKNDEMGEPLPFVVGYC